MADLSGARFVQLRTQDGHYEVVLLDAERREIGRGYKGPTPRRAEQDVKYWTHDKGLQEIPSEETGAGSGP